MSYDVLNDVFLRCVFERDNHRIVVDCGKPSVVAIFLLPMPAVAIFFDGERFRCRQDHPGSEHTYKHLGFESNVAVLHGMCHESVLCVGVNE